MRVVLATASLLILVISLTVMAMAAPSSATWVTIPAVYAPGLVAGLVLVTLFFREPLFMHVVALVCAVAAVFCILVFRLMPFIVFLVLAYLALWFIYYWRSAWSDHRDD